MSNTNTVVAAVHPRQKADESIRKPQKADFDMQKASIVGKDWRHRPPTQGDRTKFL